MSKKIVIVCALFLILAVWVWQSERPKFGGGDVYNKYSSPTIATTSVGTALWSTIVTANSGREYAIFCNDSKVSNSAIYLGLGATSTPHANGIAGIAIPSATCYEMTLDKMFTGIVYAVASSSTSTLISTYKQ